MRFVLVSTHTDQIIGYSKVAFNLLKQLSTLSPRVKTFHFGFQRHPNAAGIRKLPAGIVQYDAAANEDPKEEGFGFNRIHDYLEMVNPDVVMIYNDPLIVYRFIESMKHDKASSKYKLWIYLDQVYQGIAGPLMDKIREHADRIYCFTDIWKEQLSQYGSFPDARVLEHAVDPTVFSRLPGDVRQSVRKSMGIPDDAVVFFNGNRNSQRKRLDVCIQGFARYLTKNQNAYLVLATGVNPQTGAYYDIQRIYMREISKLKLPEVLFTRLVLVDTSQTPISDDGINQIYNATDIGVNTSDGEGFGLCQLEHLFVGAPQIVTDVGSYRSFLNDSVATFIPSKMETYFSGGMPMGGWAPIFDPDDVAAAMESAAKRLPEMREAARAHKFKTWAAVCDDWLEDVMSA
jgi:glycosyltransferase involved in cell wall biosynthesis